MRLRAVMLALAMLPLAACNDPAVYRRQSLSDRPVVSKLENTIKNLGTVVICHTRTAAWDDILAEGRRECAQFGLWAYLEYDDAAQCRMTASSAAQFRCVDPSMINSFGDGFLDPLQRNVVDNWEKRTGKTAMNRHPIRINAVTGKGEPPPAIIGLNAPRQALAAKGAMAFPGPYGGGGTQADSHAPSPPQSAERPVEITLPLRPAEHPLKPFALDQGSWGDAFEQQ